MVEKYCGKFLKVFMSQNFTSGKARPVKLRINSQMFLLGINLGRGYAKYGLRKKELGHEKNPKKAQKPLSEEQV